jgi:thymidylate kinase
VLTVALIGPDGAGKTTVARALETALPHRVEYLYMGVSQASSNRLLPTSRLAHRLKTSRRRGAIARGAGIPPGDATRRHGRPGGWIRRAGGTIIGAIRVANRLAEEAYRQGLVARYRRAGAIVILDRDFLFDYHATDIAAPGPRSFGRRVHGFVLRHFYPRPDLVIYLDAPPEVLLARKGEGTIESLSRRRDEYSRALGLAPHSAVVDASRPLDTVIRDVAQLIAAAVEERRNAR